MTNQKLLRLLEQDCTMPLDQLAAMADMPVDEVKREIKAMEEDKIILGYKAIVDWDRTERESVVCRGAHLRVFLLDPGVSPLADRCAPLCVHRLINERLMTERLMTERIMNARCVMDAAGIRKFYV